LTILESLKHSEKKLQKMLAISADVEPDRPLWLIESGIDGFPDKDLQ
jgi:hypothetical protein